MSKIDSSLAVRMSVLVLMAWVSPARAETSHTIYE